MKDKLIAFAVTLMILGLLTGLNIYMRPEEKSTPDTAPDDIREFSGDTLTDSEGGKNLIATVETNMGTFSFEFFPEDAPGTVENFVQLARDGFYDGTIFHRVIDGFMIQGGDPTGTGTGGPGYSIKAEFNDHKHVAGTVSMARSAHPDSAGSQFFVCVAPAPHLDGQYTAFGQVTDGLDVVQAIGKVKTDANDRPVEDVVMNTVTIEKKTAD